MIEVAEALTLLLNLLVAGAACAGAIAAFMGLDRWKKQSVWERDSDLARKILFAQRQRLDRFRGLRSPFISSGEMQAASDEAIDFRERKEVDQAVWLAIAKRIRRVEDGLADFHSLLLEADVFWNQGFEDCFAEMRDIETTVFFAHEELERLKRNHLENEKRDEEIKYRKQAFGSEGDELDQKYVEVARHLVAVAKQKLGRSRSISVKGGA